MSFDEKAAKNKWRFSREVTLGELLVVLTVVFYILSDHFTLVNHERRLNTAEDSINRHTTTLAGHDTEIAVIQARIGSAAHN